MKRFLLAAVLAAFAAGSVRADDDVTWSFDKRLGKVEARVGALEKLVAGLQKPVASAAAPAGVTTRQTARGTVVCDGDQCRLVPTAKAGDFAYGADCPCVAAAGSCPCPATAGGFASTGQTAAVEPVRGGFLSRLFGGRSDRPARAGLYGRIRGGGCCGN